MRKLLSAYLDGGFPLVLLVLLLSRGSAAEVPVLLPDAVGATGGGCAAGLEPLGCGAARGGTGSILFANSGEAPSEVAESGSRSSLSASDGGTGVVVAVVSECGVDVAVFTGEGVGRRRVGGIGDAVCGGPSTTASLSLEGADVAIKSDPISSHHIGDPSSLLILLLRVVDGRGGDPSELLDSAGVGFLLDPALLLFGGIYPEGPGCGD